MNNVILTMPLILILMGGLLIFLPKMTSKITLLIITVAMPIIFGLYMSMSGSISFDWLGDGSIVLGLALSKTKLLFFGMVWFSLFVYSIANLSSNIKEEGKILLTAGGMGLAIFASDFVTLFIGWEIMSWSSYLPILSRGRDVKAARRYLVYSLVGAAALLTGVLILGTSSGFSMADFQFTKGAYVSIPFFMIGFLIKSGIMPLHRWVPSVYNEATDLFSGFLSGALSKVGIYGLVLLFTLFPHSSLQLFPLMGWLGTITALFGTLRAIREIEMKRLLAWSSVAQVGYIVAAFGLGTAEGISSGLYHAIIHTIIKVLLFTIVAGVIARTGKTRFDQLGGLIYKMPFSFIAVLIGIISLAGMPPLGGFASKWAIYSAMLNSGKVLQLVVIIAASTAAFIYVYKLIYGIFLGQPTEVNPDDVKEISIGYRVGVIIPLILLIITGMFPSLVYNIINPVIIESGFTGVVQSSSHILASAFGEYNGFVVISVFGGVFALILLLFSLSKTKSRDLHRLDIAYAAETPKESYPLHYGHGMGRELTRIPFIGFWLSKSTKGFYKYIHSLMNQGASLVRVFYTGDISTFFYALFVGVVVFWFIITGGKA
ncbi:MAG: hypothetical protein B6229_02070 [Spirochaetaceae bacterium 4572_7]|nr:MAG: hypothetical protein B6229_02070 [Spirochaetaceae bacterium 4572_7]